MRLYLVQHGEAKSEDEDPERPLSDKGREEVEKVASGLKASVSEILYSPKLRARQTAEIFSRRLKAPAREIEGIKPLDDAIIAKELVESQDKDLMLVGHLPHLDRLSSLLLAGDEEAGVVKFRMGGALCLIKEEKWRMEWFLVPELL